MKEGKRNWVPTIIGLLLAGTVSPAEAREICVPAKDDASVGHCLGDAGSDASSLVEFNRQTMRSAHSSDISWGTGGVQLRGERNNTGRKSKNIMPGDRHWHRTVTGGASIWQDITPGVALFGGMRLARAKNGSSGGPLLTRQTRTYSQEAFVGLKANDRVGLTLSAFDRGGWSPGDPADAAVRMTNGEARASKGAAVELGFLKASSGDSGLARPALAFRIERSTTPSIGSETTAKVALHLSFR